MPSLRVIGVTALLVSVAAGVSVAGQNRFNVLAVDTVPAVPALQIVTLRDEAQNSCYLLFVATLTPPTRRFNVQPADVAQAAATRDRRLADLNNTYLQNFGAPVPGIPANMLPYQFEAEKIEGEFQLVVRASELTWLEDLVERTAAQTAVSGPVPCGARQ